MPTNAAGPRWDYRLLGSLEVLRDGRVCTPSALKQRALLAVLVMSANEFVSLRRLVDVLWGELPPEKAVSCVHVYIAAIRKALAGSNGHGIETLPGGYRLRAVPEHIDVHRFRALAADGDAALAGGRPERAQRLLREALGLWRGPALADLTSTGLLVDEGDVLDGLRLSVLEKRIDADLRLGLHAQVADELEWLSRQHPLREPFHLQLMRALFRCGRQAEALNAYQRVRRTLVERLGLEPGRALQEAHREVLRGAEPDEPRR